MCRPRPQPPRQRPRQRPRRRPRWRRAQAGRAQSCSACAQSCGRAPPLRSTIAALLRPRPPLALGRHPLLARLHRNRDAALLRLELHRPLLRALAVARLHRLDQLAPPPLHDLEVHEEAAQNHHDGEEHVEHLDVELPALLHRRRERRRRRRGWWALRRERRRRLHRNSPAKVQPKKDFTALSSLSWRAFTGAAQPRSHTCAMRRSRSPLHMRCAAQLMPAVLLQVASRRVDKAVLNLQRLFREGGFLERWICVRREHAACAHRRRVPRRSVHWRMVVPETTHHQHF